MATSATSPAITEIQSPPYLLRACCAVAAAAARVHDNDGKLREAVMTRLRSRSTIDSSVAVVGAGMSGAPDLLRTN